MSLEQNGRTYFFFHYDSEMHISLWYSFDIIILRYVSVGAYAICSLILLALGGYSTAIGTPLGKSYGEIESIRYQGFLISIKRKTVFNDCITI